jgi:hypothetical protein
MEKQTVHRAELKFEHDQAGTKGPVLTIEGADIDLASNPEKVLQLMDMLNLPKGSRATVTVTASTSIVR